VKTGNVHVRPELPSIEVAYETFNAGKIIHNGHAPMIGFPTGRNGTLVYDGETFLYKQFHIHSPGEHSVNGKRPAMSFNLVHESSKVHEGMNTRFAMVNVNFEINSDGEPFLGSFFDRLPSPPEEGSTEPTYVSLDDVKLSLASALFDAPDGQAWMKVPSSSFYTYHGSLTTPPCTENVKYFLMKQPLRVTEEQISKLRAVLPDRENARPIMNTQWPETPIVYTQSMEALAPRKPPALVHPRPKNPSSTTTEPPAAAAAAPDYSNEPQRFKQVAGSVIANSAAGDENLQNAATSATEVLNELAKQ
jgi:carbonic anhydrase